MLIEKDKVGGTCLHRGCIPTKALLHAGRGRRQPPASREQFGVKATFEGIDMAGVNTYKDTVVARLYKGLQGLVKSRGITVVEGDGRLAAPNAVEVDGTRTRAATSSSRPARTPARCPAWRSTAPGSSPASRR